MPPTPITAVFAELPDPRRDTANKLHLPVDIPAQATCAVIAGADSWEAIAEYGRTEGPSFRRSLTLGHGIPGPDTFERVFAKLAPGAFAGAFGRWMASACEASGPVPIAIDGKSARAAKRNTATGCLHVVTAWAVGNRPVLGTAAVADGSNEVAAIPEPLRTLDLAGAIVTIDAAGRQLENARIIRGRKGHCLLAVEGNQPTLRAAVEGALERACEADLVGARSDGHESAEDGHGRHEERYVTVVHAPEGPPSEWPDVAAVAQVNREREVGGKRTVTNHHYISSHEATAAEFAGWVGGHWGIENPQSEDRRCDNLCVERPGHWGIENPQSEDRRCDNLCVERPARYHRHGGPARAGRVVRPASGPGRSSMLIERSDRVPPRPRPYRRPG